MELLQFLGVARKSRERDKVYGVCVGVYKRERYVLVWVLACVCEFVWVVSICTCVWECLYEFVCESVCMSLCVSLCVSVKVCVWVCKSLKEINLIQSLYICSLPGYKRLQKPEFSIHCTKGSSRSTAKCEFEKGRVCVWVVFCKGVCVWVRVFVF